LKPYPATTGTMKLPRIITLQLAVLSPAAAIAQWPVHLEILYGQNAPVTGLSGNATMGNYAIPTLNHAGKIAFTAYVQGGGAPIRFDNALIVDTGEGAFAEIVAGSPAPGSGDLFLDFKGPPVVNRNGDMLISANLINGSGLFLRDDSGLHLIADTFSQPPGTEAGTTFFNSTGFFTDRGLTTDGEVFFRASLAGGAINQANDSGLWSWAGGTLRSLARESGPIPSGNGVSFSWSSAALYFQPMVSTAGGRMAFVSTLAGPGVVLANNEALFSGAPDALDIFLRKGDPAVAPGLPPDARHGPASVRPIGLNDSGEMIFISNLSGTGINTSNDHTVWKAASGNLEMMFREGEQVPGAPAGVHFSNAAISQLARGIALNSAGESVIYMSLAGPAVTAADDSALFTDVGGNPGFIVREGDAAPGLPGVTVASLSARPFMLNGRGDVALYLQLAGAGITFSNNEALYFWTREHGLQLVYQKGTPSDFGGGTFIPNITRLPDYTVGDDQAAGLIFNNRGQLVLATDLGSTRHIIRATLMRPAAYQWIATGSTTGLPQASSANYRTDTAGDGLAGPSWASANYQVKPGYVGQLTDVTAVEASINGTSIAEAAEVRVSALLRLDDDTFLSPEPGSLTWQMISGPILAVTPGGLLTTGLVYQHEPAWVRAHHALGFGDGMFTVLDSDDDNFREYAGDGLPDHWQVTYFGLPPNALAHPGADPDFNGQNNFFEFLAGTDPNNPASLFQTKLNPSPDGGFSITLNQVVPGTRYRVLRSQDSKDWRELTEITVNEPQAELKVQDPVPFPGSGFYRVTMEKDLP